MPNQNVNKTHGRFHIDHRTEVINKYVLYVEDLFVSFKDNEIKKELKNDLKTLKKKLKVLTNPKTNLSTINKYKKIIDKKQKELETKPWIKNQENIKYQIQEHEKTVELLIGQGVSEENTKVTTEMKFIKRKKNDLEIEESKDFETSIIERIKTLEEQIHNLTDPTILEQRTKDVREQINTLEEKIFNKSLKEELKQLKQQAAEELKYLKIDMDNEKAKASENGGKDYKHSLEEVFERMDKAFEKRKNELEADIKVAKDKIKFSDPSVKRILNGVTFGLRKGETLAIVGANGAGKTVLLETILGLNIPDSYSRMVLNLGRKHYANNLKEVGIQYQQSKMSASMTVRKLIDDYKKLYIDRIDESLIEKMLDVFHIRPFYPSKVDSLSGGQKQRLNLLLAVINNPKIMILDEFITGLDVNSVEEIINFIAELKVKLNASMIIISHQPEEIEELADRVLLMKEGAIVLETYVEDIVEEYGSVTDFIREMI